MNDECVCIHIMHYIIHVIPSVCAFAYVLMTRFTLTAQGSTLDVRL